MTVQGAMQDLGLFVLVFVAVGTLLVVADTTFLTAFFSADHNLWLWLSALLLSAAAIDTIDP